MPRGQWPALARGDVMQVAIRHPAIPDLDRATLKTQGQQGRAAEHVHRQDTLEFGIHFPQGFGQAIALGGHAVEHFSQWHGANRRRQPMAGEIAEQHLHVTGWGERGQQ
ncbi:hypothetical protein D3C86_1836170 [compost metagenome]